MAGTSSSDAGVVGSGPTGLAAAIALAKAGRPGLRSSHAQLLRTPPRTAPQSATGSKRARSDYREQERIDVSVKLLPDEIDALVTTVKGYYDKLTRAGVPEELAARLVQDFHSWMLSYYRLTSERD